MFWPLFSRSWAEWGLWCASGAEREGPHLQHWAWSLWHCVPRNWLSLIGLQSCKLTLKWAESLSRWLTSDWRPFGHNSVANRGCASCVTIATTETTDCATPEPKSSDLCSASQSRAISCLGAKIGWILCDNWVTVVVNWPPIENTH